MILLLRNKVVALLVCLGSLSLAAQNFKTTDPANTITIIDANGRPLQLNQGFKPDGHPFYYEEYLPAQMIGVRGEVYTDIRVKFNITDRQIQYLDTKGTEMLLDIPIKSIHLLNLVRDDNSMVDVTLQSDSGILNSGNGAVYEQLETGKISLLKKIEINWWEEKKYGEINITRHYVRKEIPFLLLANGEYKKLEKSKDFIIALMENKKTEINSYINTNKIRCKTLPDFQRIIAYYNSLN